MARRIARNLADSYRVEQSHHAILFPVSAMLAVLSFHVPSQCLSGP